MWIVTPSTPRSWPSLVRVAARPAAVAGFAGASQAHAGRRRTASQMAAMNDDSQYRGQHAAPAPPVSSFAVNSLEIVQPLDEGRFARGRAVRPGRTEVGCTPRLRCSVWRREALGYALRLGPGCALRQDCRSGHGSGFQRTWGSAAGWAVRRGAERQRGVTPSAAEGLSAGALRPGRALADGDKSNLQEEQE